MSDQQTNEGRTDRNDVGDVEIVPWTLPLVLRALAGGAADPQAVRAGDRAAIIEAARDRIDNDSLSEDERLILVRAGYHELDE